MKLSIPPAKQKKPAPDLPWFVPGAIEALYHLLKKGEVRSVLEFGSGGSTVFLAAHGASVVSIEHDPRWAARTQSELIARQLAGQVRLAPPDSQAQHPVYAGRDGRSYRQYVKYGTAAAREQFSGELDCLVVDGRARVACVTAARRYVKPGGFIVLDDAERTTYVPVAQLLTSLGWQRLRYGCGKHRTDIWRAPEWGGYDGQRILVLSSDRPRGRHNDLLHRGFFEACPLPVDWYGPGERGRVPFQPDRPLAEAVHDSGATLVVVNMKSRVHSWLQLEEFAALSAKKAIVEVDYCYAGRTAGDRADHYRGADDWFRRAEFDHVFFRHKVDVERSALPYRSWLPFSNDPAIFRPYAAPDIDVGFAGTLRPRELYATRCAAVAALAGQIEVRERTLTGIDFAQFLARCCIGVTCGGAFGYDNAKHVQIPATGALLATDVSVGTPDLLPDPEMYLAYSPDTIRGQVREVLADEAQRKERTTRAMDYCLTHHTHGHRWRQVLSCLVPALEDYQASRT